MDFSQVPIQVALIAAAVTLLGTLISFLSALLGHWYNRIAKVQDWLFAKRVADIETCTAKLDSWITELSETSSETNLAFIRIDFEADLQTKFVSSIENHSSRANVAFKKALMETSEMASKAEKTATERTYNARMWIGHDLARLSTWLKEPDSNEKSFRNLYIRYAKVMVGFSQIARDIEGWTKGYSSNLTDSIEEVTQKLKSHENQLDSLSKEQGKFGKEAMALQRTMALELANSTASFWNFLRETLLHDK